MGFSAMKAKADAVWTMLAKHRRIGCKSPMTAIELGRAMGFSGDHETVRRRIRDIVKYGRETLGLRICAGVGRQNDCGYWSARSDREWANYRRSVFDGLRFRFVSMARAKRASNERLNGQKLLFDVRAVVIP